MAWRINPFAVGSGSLGSQVVNAFLEVSLTLLIAYGAWQFVRITIDRKIAEEDAALAAQGIDPSESEVGGGYLECARSCRCLNVHYRQRFSSLR